MKAIVPITTLLAVICGMTQDAVAQVVPDNTLGTQVTQSGAVFNINNGTRSGNNLFHSFSQFSIPTGGSAIFNNTLDVQNIFSRVTGSQLSNIDGILKTQGNANLFLMNPNGIVFGENAQLQLGGSFLGTTANSIKFEDSIEFNTVNATPALLSVNVPIGLQMGSNPGAITIQGTGHLLRTQNSILAPYFPIAPMSGLSVAPRNTLALVGGPMAIDGGVLTAPEGRVELASLGQGASVPILQSTSANNSAITLGDITGDRNTIQLSNKALVDVNGIDGGSIQVQGKQVDLTTGALFWVQNRGQNTAGDIQINATDRILLNGTAPDLISITPIGVLFNSVSAIVNETVSSGNGGNISLNAPNITVQNGANVMSRSYAQGASGDINLQAQTLNIVGTSMLVPDIFSVIASNTIGPGKGGNVVATLRDLSILNGGTVSASTVGPGMGGNIIVNADTVLVSGLSPKLSASSLTAPTIGGNGNGGNLLLNTRRLTVEKGGVVVTSSFGPGNAGKLTINASESIDLLGQIQQSNEVYNTGIASAVGPAKEPYLSLFNIITQPTGSSGAIEIMTPKLTLTDEAYITVNNDGPGVAGNLNIQADRIELSNGSSLSAGSLTGQGGNISVNSRVLLLRTLSQIYTSAEGNGNGGNISISSDLIAGLENSDIIANALAGRGGNIAITTQGILGLRYRNSLTLDNDITASSEFGISGNVQVNTIGINPANSLNALPSNIVDSSRQIADRCGASKTSSFIATGRGGIPQSPTKRNSADRPWNDLRPTVATNSVASQPLARSQPLVEASRIEVDAAGAIVLGTGSANVLAAAKPVGVQTNTTCGMSGGEIAREHSR